MQIPLDPKIRELSEMPYTISYVIRKRQQVDNLNELPKEKRPPESMIWDGTSEEIDEWLDKVFDSKKGYKDTVEFTFDPKKVEGR